MEKGCLSNLTEKTKLRILDYLTCGDVSILQQDVHEISQFLDFFKTLPGKHKEVDVLLRALSVSGNKKATFNKKTFDDVSPLYTNYIITFYVCVNTRSLWINVFNAENGQNVQMQSKCKFAPGFAMCSLHNDHREPPIICVSGGRSTKSAAQFLEYDVIKAKWKSRPEMLYKRHSHKIVGVNGTVYAVGGRNLNRNIPFVEKYDRKRKKWRVSCRLDYPVHDFACVKCRDVIYIFGGRNDNGENIFLIQSIDTRTGTAAVCGYMPNECNGGSAEVINDAIYYFSTEGHFMVFKPETNTAHALPSLPSKDSPFTYVKNNSFYVVFSGNERPNRQYVYRADKNFWDTETDPSVSAFTPVSGQCSVKIPADVKHRPFID